MATDAVICHTLTFSVGLSFPLDICFDVIQNRKRPTYNTLLYLLSLSKGHDVDYFFERRKRKKKKKHK